MGFRSGEDLCLDAVSKQLHGNELLVKPQQNKLSPAQKTAYRGYTPQGIPSFPVGPPGEDEMGWKAYTSTLEGQACELQKKTRTNRNFSREVATEVFSGQFPDRVEGLILFL